MKMMKNSLLRVVCMLAVIPLVTSVDAVAETKGRTLNLKIKSIMDVMGDRGNFTYIPKRSVLHVPKGLEAKFLPEKDRTYLRFGDFYKKNQVWIMKVEVSQSEMEGDAPLCEERLERLKKTGKVVIAVRNGQPTSIVRKKQMNLTEVRIEK
ncbi:hypothetical protein [Rubritalea tangerina]|uniref:Uncharacterized protein n=1 Tax=Rubritalea tangerina TaxID=430798 RepID=A0ABW4Z9J4_9BACT